MMLEYFQGVVADLERKVAGPGQATPRRLYALEMARLGMRLYDGRHRVAWCGVVAPFDLLNAMGLTSCFVEFVGASLAGSGMVETFIDRAEEGGLAPDMCSYHRAVTGAALQGMMPVPELLVGTTCPCSAGQSTIENLARIFERPMTMLHVPQIETPAAVVYLAEQLGAMVSFIEKKVGTRLDPQRLGHAMELANEAAALMRQIYELAARVPSPVSSNEMKDFGIAMPLLLGTEEALLVARAYRDELASRTGAGTGTGAGAGERVRLLWIQNRIQFRQPLVKMLERELGAVIVVDELNDVTWDPVDPGDPLPGIARRMIGNSFNGPIETRIRRMRDLARRYRVHGAVNPCNWGCRQGAGARGMMQEGLGQAGVPVLNLEVDCVDPRSFSEGQLRTRLEAFVEMIENRPSPWR